MSNNPKTPVRSASFARFFILGAGLLFIAAASALLLWSSEGRVPVEAEVETTTIRSTRPGTLAWSLMVDCTYRVDGVLYSKSNLEVFHDTEFAVTESQQRHWPEGKVFLAYYRPADPADLSLHQGEGADQVLAVMLLLIGLIVMFPAIVAWRRAEKNKTNSTGE